MWKEMVDGEIWELVASDDFWNLLNFVLWEQMFSMAAKNTLVYTCEYEEFRTRNIAKTNTKLEDLNLLVEPRLKTFDHQF